MLLDKRLVIFKKYFNNRLPNEFLNRISKLLGAKLINGKDLPILSHGEIHRRVVLIQSTITFFTRLEGFLRQFPIGNLLNHRYMQTRIRGFQPQRNAS